ncbi:MAG TPA: DUF5916 domain-containing protein, partial [Bacteroidota bacterium]|nr:DUF5916 domain-containing protein [Bacteroidota bacterium]
MISYLRTLQKFDFLFLLIIFIIIATTSVIANNDTSSFTPNYLPMLDIPYYNGNIKIDGKLDDEGWKIANIASNFSEASPGDRIKPKVDTKVLAVYNNEYVYFAFICYDNPKKVRYSFTDRDACFNDDIVAIILDTYGNAEWAYEIFVNPLGIQADARWSPSGEDISFDFIFYSKGMLTDSGYQVEVAIPFSSLRFPNKPEQVWRATFWRNHSSDTRRQYSWAAISQNNPCLPCQFGYLTGIKNVKSINRLELLPSLIAHQSGYLSNANSSNQHFVEGKVKIDPSLGIRYSFSPSLTAEATINPDFSQVESDVQQIDVNSTFALYYDEKRPFFQEAGDLLQSRFNTIYTRSINDPLYGARVTGRFNKSSLAIISAYDEYSPLIVPQEEHSYSLYGGAGKSLINILRYKQTIYENSYIGAIVTDRRFEDNGAGTLLSLDGSLRFVDNYYFKFQYANSYTSNVNDSVLNGQISQDGKRPKIFENCSSWGRAMNAAFSRDAKYWDLTLSYEEINPTFRADVGLMPKNNYRQSRFYTDYKFYTDSKYFDIIIPSIEVARVWNFDGIRKDQWISPSLYIQFKAQTYLTLWYLWSRERFEGIDFPGIKRGGISINSNFTDLISLYFNIESGRMIARNLDKPILGKGNNIGCGMSLKLFKRFFIDPDYSFSDLKDPLTNTVIFNGYILRTKFTYQFTRELFIRLVAQYDHFSDRFDIEPLIYYKLNPFSIFYIGSTLDYNYYNDYNN